MLREIADDPGHPDRSSVLPEPDELERKQTSGEQYAWKVHRDLLLKRFPVEDTTRRRRPGDSSKKGSRDEADVLRSQLQGKDQYVSFLEEQVRTKDGQLAEMNERLRESHVLIKDLQQKSAGALPSPSENNSRHKPFWRRPIRLFGRG
ncbi:hypothetical protein [Stratiformator vulcanicus]|uniref:Chromosome partition protein Smc n=1 Tax=Stratiformator vulcanicus TaxID=2527980 RepID=A0A517R3F5_9PLAN|nr:hypothetical protein [Stratiformator vulcanicus]QDT38380.1 hypothetical protein Pan189_27730 [Stratiformator vulcanicus]